MEIENERILEIDEALTLESDFYWKMKMKMMPLNKNTKILNFIRLTNDFLSIISKILNVIMIN